MNLLKRLRSPRTAFIHDLLIVPMAWFGAYWFRFNLEAIPEPYLSTAWTWAPALVFIQGAAFVYLGLYRGNWRFASLPDLIRIIKAVAIGITVSALLIFLATRLANVPRSIFPVYGILLCLGLGAPRFLYRWFKDRGLYLGEGKRVLIIGAGRAGEMLVRDLLRNASKSLLPVGFVDDKYKNRGLDVHGIRVLGGCAAIPELCEELGIDLIVIALPSANSRQMRRVVEHCEQAGVPFQTLPRVEDLVSGRVSVNKLREVSIDDLLGRDSVTLDWSRVREGLAGKRILVTGGGGSIGSGLALQVARHKPDALTIFEQSEYNLYRIEMDLKREYPGLVLHACLGDVSDPASVASAMERFQPQVIFHAAAYKHVPMLEGQIREAVWNNVLGTRVIASAAERHGCETFVLISTDKAVNPANVMGATKRAAEIYCQNLNQRSATHFLTVRFGNVLESAGSVVPLFKKQIEAGGPVTVTHPEITRFFMTIPEACQLILQASVMGAGGEIFVLDMGQPIKIAYLAEQIIRLSGKVPGEDIDIIFTGLRPGEKLYEELFHEQEALQSTSHKKILLARHRDCDWASLSEVMEQIDEACARYDEEKLRMLLKELVPEWGDHAAVAREEDIIPAKEDRLLGKEEQPILH